MTRAKTADIAVVLPPKLAPIFSAPRGSVQYRGAYGGRGSAKSFTFAKMAAVFGFAEQLRILCTRELQVSIKESFHAELKNAIASEPWLSAHYDVGESYIRGKNGTEFMFRGLRHNIQNIKSTAQVDITILEEAEDVPEASWRDLEPTVLRRDKSEIWVIWNPREEGSPVDDRFRKHPPANALITEMNYRDNPWFPDGLNTLRQRDEARLPTQLYDHIWNGAYNDAVEGAIYGDEVRDARKAGRITEVPYDPSLPVHTFWDLGVLDPTSVWFVQQSGGEIRIIDYYEASDLGLTAHAQVLQSKGYNYGRHYAPHDIQVRDFSTGRTRLEAAAALGIRFEVVPRQSVEDGIHAARMIMPRCWFDSIRTKTGVNSLANYRKAYNTSLGQFTATPVHDHTSHAADAFRYMAVSLTEEKPKPKKLGGNFGSSQAWMG